METLCTHLPGETVAYLSCLEPYPAQEDHREIVQPDDKVDLGREPDRLYGFRQLAFDLNPALSVAREGHHD